ncbi:MAG: hypothetical protein ACM3XS_08760 [Bacteroidota bacterium]
MRRLWPVFLAAAILFASGRSARASVHLDLSLSTPYYGLREFKPGEPEDDYIYQVYGLELRGHYVAEKSGFQLELGYLYAPEDMGGRQITATRERASLRIPWHREAVDDGMTLYTYVLSWQHEALTDGTPVYDAQTGLLGVEIYAGEEASGSVALGAGAGRRLLRLQGLEASGYAASFWLSLTVALGQLGELRLANTTVWAWPEGTGGRVMERTTDTSIGLGIHF